KKFQTTNNTCQSLPGCGVVVHKHCENRCPPCKALIESGSYVTMSRKKIVKALDDLDDLAQFLLDKISMLNRDGSTGSSKVDRVFETALLELHHSLVSNYSLTLQKSLDVSDHLRESGTKPPPSPTTPQSTEVDQRVTITFAQLVNNFTNIFKGIAKRQGLNDPGYLAISVNQMKSFLDEFSKGRRKSMVKAMSGGIEPATLRRKTFSGHGLELVDHNGHRFFTETFKVATVCEYCNDPIPLLEKGEVCIVCEYTCHQSCLKLTSGRCEGKDRAKSPPATNKPETSQSRSQFGVALECLVPPDSTQVPAVLEKCLHYIEDQGLYVQGIYRKSPGASSKRAVKATLEEDPGGCSLEGFHVNAVAAAVGAFFRELPTPLIPKDRYTDILRTIDLTDREEMLEALHHLLNRLPALNYAVFERLIFHLARVAEQEPANKMSPYNLAVIFAPCLFQGETKSRNPQDLIKELAKQTMSAG
ncbi:Unconventional myosin-IXa, partial [Geodia barretti]